MKTYSPNSQSCTVQKKHDSQIVSQTSHATIRKLVLKTRHKPTYLCPLIFTRIDCLDKSGPDKFVSAESKITFTNNNSVIST